MRMGVSARVREFGNRTMPIINVARAWRLLAAPAAEWAHIRVEAPSWRVTLLAYALPLAALGPVCHLLGVWLRSPGLRAGPPVPLLVGAVAIVAAGVLASLALCVLIALAIQVLAPVFRGRRGWSAAWRVGAYALTPVWLAAVALFWPLREQPGLAVLMMAAAVHAFYLVHLGAQALMGVPEDEAAIFAAFVFGASVAGSIAIGFVAGALGLLPQV